MQNKESLFEKDPQLRRSEFPTQKASNLEDNKWIETMKDMPSFSEHIKQVESKNSVNQNAFNQATKSNSKQSINQSNAFSKSVNSFQDKTSNISNNAIRSISKVSSKSINGKANNESTNHNHSAIRTK